MREIEADVPGRKNDGRCHVAGQAVPKGQIQFIPQGGNQGTPVSAAIVEGRYQADNVPLGKVTVMFRATRPTGKMDAKCTSTPEAGFVDLIPKKYRGGVTLEVTGDGTHDFQLK